jgi:hypothetical protein
VILADAAVRPAASGLRSIDRLQGAWSLLPLCR